MPWRPYHDLESWNCELSRFAIVNPSIPKGIFKRMQFAPKGNANEFAAETLAGRTRAAVGESLPVYRPHRRIRWWFRRTGLIRRLHDERHVCHHVVHFHVEREHGRGLKDSSFYTSNIFAGSITQWSMSGVRGTTLPLTGYAMAFSPAVEGMSFNVPRPSFLSRARRIASSQAPRLSRRPHLRLFSPGAEHDQPLGVQVRAPG